MMLNAEHYAERCRYCRKRLGKEIHAVKGMLFCSKACAVAYKIEDIEHSTIELAETWYDECGEVVNASDIGIEVND